MAHSHLREPECHRCRGFKALLDKIEKVRIAAPSRERGEASTIPVEGRTTLFRRAELRDLYLEGIARAA
ncbi:MAG: hypothetical protein KBA31_18085 [Alphaproteobacteria bacterium]|nr:hypothetical protein [Alphaproteobacteria bacterium]